MLNKLRNMINARVNLGRRNDYTYRKKIRTVGMTTYREEVTFFNNNSNVTGKGKLSVDYPSSLFRLNVGVYNNLSKKDIQIISKSIVLLVGKGIDCNGFNCHVVNINFSHQDKEVVLTTLDLINNYIRSNEIDAEINSFENNQIIITRP